MINPRNMFYKANCAESGESKRFIILYLRNWLFIASCLFPETYCIIIYAYHFFLLANNFSVNMKEVHWHCNICTKLHNLLTWFLLKAYSSFLQYFFFWLLYINKSFIFLQRCYRVCSRLTWMTRMDWISMVRWRTCLDTQSSSLRTVKGNGESTRVIIHQTWVHIVIVFFEILKLPLI